MKTLMISDETYTKLATIKGDKSFTELLSELVERVKQSNVKELMKFAGIMSDKEAKELERAVARIHKHARARI